MKVWYRFPDIDEFHTLSEEKTDKELQLYCYTQNHELLYKMKEWFESINEEIPKVSKFESYHDPYKFCIMVAVCFEMKDDIASLFKMKFGDGFNGDN